MHPNINPYTFDHSTNPDIAKLKISRRRLNFILFMFIFMSSLFLPTFEMRQLNVPLGRVPVWFAYVAIFDRIFFRVAIAVVFTHIGASYLISAFATFCASSIYLTGRESIHVGKGDTPDESQVNRSELQ